MLDNLTDRITESKVSDLWNVIHQSKVQTYMRTKKTDFAALTGI